MMERNVPEYYDNFNPNLLAAIPAGSATVLEIGCGAGRLGSVYKGQNPASRYIGVKFDAFDQRTSVFRYLITAAKAA